VELAASIAREKEEKDLILLRSVPSLALLSCSLPCHALSSLGSDLLRLLRLSS
jgi:hypothetical protein